jgi:hypothetical protein
MSKFKAAKEAGKLFEYFFDRLLKGFRKDQGRDPENLEMILIRQEAGNKAKEADKVIEVQFGKSFGEEVDDLIKSGDVKIGEVTKKNDNVLQREMFQNSNLNKPTIEGQMEKITGASNKIKGIQKEIDEMYRPKTDAEIKAKFDKQNKESIERLKKKKEDDPGFYTGGITDVEPSLDDIGHGSDSLMARTRLVSPGSQATTSTGLNYLLAEDNDNIRVPFAKGKIAKEVLDKGRRGFMKAAGATGAGIAALKTGLLGLGEKAAPVVEKAVETVSDTAGQVPPYFFKLVNKIRTLGEETLASQDKAIAKKYKDYVMEEDFAGNISIIKKDMDNPYPTEVIMDYKVDEVAMKNKKGSTKVEEYEEFTARPDFDGKMKDVEGGVPDEVIEEAMTETITKKAEGGRIGFSKGKLATNAVKFLEKIFGKENMAEMPNRDPEMYQGMLEVVDMFRNRDKEGLKKYLQKFLPHMDDAQVEDFIVGDAEDMAGLGKFGLGNLQGQLIRLGSGRDYAGKIEAFKRLERNKSLKDLEVTEDMQRKPNASGGLAKMLGE